MSVSSRIRRTALALSVGAVAAASMSPATAEAEVGRPSGRLAVVPVSPGHHNVAVSGGVRMTPNEAAWLVKLGYRVQLRVWGSDAFSDDLLIGPYHATPVATDMGLAFESVLVQIDDDRLDEDWGTDELYVGMRLMKPDGTTIRSGQTSVVLGDF